MEKMSKSGADKESAIEEAPFELEAIIKAKYRPALVFDKDHALRAGDLDRLGMMEESNSGSWKDLVINALRAKTAGGQTIGAISRKVARVEHAAGACVGTAWVISEQEDIRMITNRHVVREQSWFYEKAPGQWVAIDDRRGVLNYNAVWNSQGNDLDEFDVSNVLKEPGPDASVLTPDRKDRSGLEVVRAVEEFGWQGKLEDILKDRLVVVIGHPVASGSDPADEVDLVFGAAPLKLKRFMPGKLQVKPLGNYAGMPVLMHDGSTLKGASGSCVIDLGPVGTDLTKPENLPPTFGKVIGLHFGGLWSSANYAVPTWELAKLGIFS